MDVHVRGATGMREQRGVVGLDGGVAVDSERVGEPHRDHGGLQAVLNGKPIPRSVARQSVPMISAVRTSSVDSVEERIAKLLDGVGRSDVVEAETRQDFVGRRRVGDEPRREAEDANGDLSSMARTRSAIIIPIPPLRIRASSMTTAA